jgi:hypothetical protein
MMTPQQNQLKDRAAKLLGMLGSDYDGEVVNAGRSAHRLINQSGSTWTELLTDTKRSSDGDNVVERARLQAALVIITRLNNDNAVLNARVGRLQTENNNLRAEARRLKVLKGVLSSLDDQLKFVLRHDELLNTWQYEFVYSLLDHKHYSPRQKEKLAEVVDAVKRKLAANQIKNPVDARCVVKDDKGDWHFATVEHVEGAEVTVRRDDGVRLYGDLYDRDLCILA